MHYVVFRQHAAAWDDSLPLRGQQKWAEHAAYMDALHAERFLLLAGPLRDGALLIVSAGGEDEVHNRLNDDPWTGMGLLRTSSVDAWEILLGEIAAP
jgi:uncharacterized protein YciI